MTRQDLADQITENQHTFKKLEIDLSRYTTDTNPRVKFEFQEIGTEMAQWFKGNIWWIFTRPEAKLDKVKFAFDQCKKYDKKDIGYLLKILKQ